MGRRAERRLCPRRLGRAAHVIAAGVVVLLSGCNYSFRGGSFPAHIRTVAVVPFENETTRLELTQELHSIMQRNLPRALGVRAGGEEVADAVVRGTITSYDVTAPNYRPGAGGERAEVLQRQVMIGLQVEIVDRVQNVVLWEDSGLRAEGVYLEATETEETGKQIALELLVQRVVDGAQSNW